LPLLLSQASYPPSLQPPWRGTKEKAVQAGSLHQLWISWQRENKEQ
jgi:hypothetical protein